MADDVAVMDAVDPFSDETTQSDDEIVDDLIALDKPDEKEVFVSGTRLDDGRFEIKTNKRALLIEQRTTEYFELLNKLRNLKLNANGYICCGVMPLHQFVGDRFCKTDQQVRALYPEHFAVNPLDITVIMHLDNDKLNFNIANLERGPQMLNLYMQKCQPKPNGKKFYGSVSINNKQECTKSVASKEEAKHATDILKIQRMPLEFREHIFKYATHKPAKYSQYYTSVETLLARAPLYAKQARKPQKPRESKNVYEAFRTLDLARKALTAEQMKIIQAILETPRVATFDELLDAIIRYTGSRGKQIVQLMEYACFAKYMEKTSPRMTTSGDGYLQIKLPDGLNSIHNVVLGRPLGQKARDGLDGGHGYGKTLDNRKRSLQPQTRGNNNSQRGQYDNKSVPNVVGVTLLKSGKYVAQIGSFFERADHVFLGSYSTSEGASAVYQFALANKAQLVEKCKDVWDRNAELRARCVAKRV